MQEACRPGVEEGPLCWSVHCVESAAESVESAAPLLRVEEEEEEVSWRLAALKLSLRSSLLLLESMRSPQETMLELKLALPSVPKLGLEEGRCYQSNQGS